MTTEQHNDQAQDAIEPDADGYFRTEHVLPRNCEFVWNGYMEVQYANGKWYYWDSTEARCRMRNVPAKWCRLPKAVQA